VAGSIYLIPGTLGGRDFREVIPDNVLNITRSLRYFIAEEIRSARRYLRLIDKGFPIDDAVFYILNEHTDESCIEGYLDPLKKGYDIGLMSEAGLPGIADPGSRIIRIAHRLNLRVIPLSGPSSVIMALISSGFNGQNFTFHGYLPIRDTDRISRLREIEKRISRGETQIFMETPYRAQKMAESIFAECNPETSLCIAKDISLMTEEIRTMKISEWKKRKPDLNHRLVIFLMGL
jgi:16S rRNA (cytidine1402-2'-O)-methyltransferase